MKTIHYFRLLPLLLFAAACQPEPEEPSPADPDTAADAPSAMNDMPAQSAPEADRAAPKRVAEVKIAATEGNQASGTVRFLPQGDTVRMEGTISGLEPGAHGLHIHARGDCSAPDAKSAGDHFSPNDNPHGSPRDLPDQHHLGDFGNITANAQGTAEIMAEDQELQLSGPNSVIGKALIVHAGRDDLKSQPSGDSGARVGCGVIREAVQTADARS